MKGASGRNTCLAVAATVMITAIILLILCFMVFKAKNPHTTVTAVVLRNLQAEFDIPNLSVYVNLTLDVSLSVKNPNKVGFKFTNSTASVKYRGALVGQAPIGAGEISAGQTKPMAVTLTVMADRFIAKSSELFPDVVAGTIPLNTLTRISGKVTVLGIFKVHVVSSASCHFNVYVSNNSVGDQVCTLQD